MAAKTTPGLSEGGLLEADALSPDFNAQESSQTQKSSAALKSAPPGAPEPPLRGSRTPFDNNKRRRPRKCNSSLLSPLFRRPLSAPERSLRLTINAGPCAAGQGPSESARGRFPEMDGDVQKALRNAPAYWGLCFFPSLLMTTIYHNLLFIVLWRFLYCYANATAIFPISKMLTGKTRSPEALLAFRPSLMSSLRWPLNCFTCTFSSFRVKARSSSWGGERENKKWAEMRKPPERAEFACFLAVRALKRWRQPSGGVQTRQLVSVERHQLNRRSDAIRQQEPRELVQLSTQIDRRGGGCLPGSGTMEMIQAMETTWHGEQQGCTYHPCAAG